MLTFPRIGLVLLVAVALAGCSSGIQILSDGKLVSRYTAEDGRQIFQLLLSEPSFKEVADKVAPVTVRAEITVREYRKEWTDWGTLRIKAENRIETFDYEYAEGNVTTVTRDDPDFTLRTTQSIALDVLNADDGFRVFACALKDKAATLEATNPIHAASFNAAKGRIVGTTTDCRAKVGDAVTWKGERGVLFSLDEDLLARMGNESGDYLVFDKYRAPIAWLPASRDYCKNRDDCTGAGYSAKSRDIGACADEVNKAYAKADPVGWDAGLHVSKAAKKAAELTACKLVLGGS